MAQGKNKKKERKTSPSHHTTGNNSEIVRRRISLLPVGGKMRDLPKELWHESYLRGKKTGGPNLRLLRLDPNKPSHTVTAYIFNKFVHPREDRYLTPREAARLQGFPDDFGFCGPTTSVQTQVGNAVPVQLAEAVAAHVKNYLTKHFDKNIYHALSLFSGAGGMDLGFSKRFKTLSAVEYEKNFADTLQRNFKDIVVYHKDIREINAKKISFGKKVHLVFGGPPCQSFSAAGKQKGFADLRGQMIAEFTRLVKEARPEVFVMENVPGMLGVEKGKVIEQIKKEFADVGYFTEVHLLKATDYGAPQMRRRLFFLGRKKKYKEAMGAPPPTHSENPSLFGLKPCMTVGEALKNLPEPSRRE